MKEVPIFLVVLIILVVLMIYFQNVSFVKNRQAY